MALGERRSKGTRNGHPVPGWPNSAASGQVGREGEPPEVVSMKWTVRVVPACLDRIVFGFEATVSALMERIID